MDKDVLLTSVNIETLKLDMKMNVSRIFSPRKIKKKVKGYNQNSGFKSGKEMKVAKLNFSSLFEALILNIL